MSHDVIPPADAKQPVEADRPIDVASHAPRRGMRAPLAGFLIVMGQGLREALQPKRLIVSIAIMVGLGAAIAFGARAEADRPFRRDLLFQIWEGIDLWVLQILLPLVALILVGPVYSRELRQRTMVYHLVRPVSRTTVFLARFVSGVLPAAVFGTLLCLSIIAFADAGAPPEVWTALPLLAFFAALVLGAIYCTLGAIFKRGLIAGLLYTFMMEVIVAGLPGNIQTLSVRFHLRSLYHGLVDPAFAERSEGVRSRIDGTMQSASNPLVEAVPFDPPQTAVMMLLGIALAILIIGVTHVRSRDFALKD
ncbi:MAG: ABC transporter permease [Planctomycetota bacterium]|nr:ABC transporter permease [Planctomycetota bacterium]